MCVCVCIIIHNVRQDIVQMSIFDKIPWSLSMYTSLRDHNLGLDSEPIGV